VPLVAILALCAATAVVVLARAEDDAKEAKGGAEETKEGDESKGDMPAALGEFDDEMEVEDAIEPLTEEALKKLHGRIDKDGNGHVSMEEVIGFADVMRKKASNEDVEMLLGDVDTNHDGKLSMEEYMNEVKHFSEDQPDGHLAEGEGAELKKQQEERAKVEESKFVAADSDGDKVLDINEYPGLFFPETNDKVLEVEVQETMKMRDTDKDGQLTQSEFFEVPDKEVMAEDKTMFAKLDKNGDGKLDVSEIKMWESGQFQTAESIEELFKIADKDKDGHVTAEELIQAREEIAETEAHEHLAAWATANEL